VVGPVFWYFRYCFDVRPMKPMIRSIVLSLFTCFSLSAFSTEETRLTAVDYISLWKDEAVYQMVVHRVPASITLAQGMLESGNGNSRLAVEGNNHFGIKCHSDWTGKTILEDDETRGECFRKYRDARDSFDDHSVFLKRKRYTSLFELELSDYRGWAHGLKQCGYATNPNYPQALIRLIDAHQLAQYDLIGLEYIARNDVPRRGEGVSPDSKPADNQRSEQKRDVSRSRKGYDPDSPGQITITHGREVRVSANRIRYVIAISNETPESIAQSLDMGPWQIRKYNDLSRGEVIPVGSIIYLQPKRNKASEATHTVVAGETVGSVSQRYGVKVKRLIKYNGLTESGTLKEGQKLRLR